MDQARAKYESHGLERLKMFEKLYARVYTVNDRYKSALKAFRNM